MVREGEEDREQDGYRHFERHKRMPLFIRHLVYKFMLPLSESANTLISAILASDIRWTSHMYRYIVC